MTQNSESLDAGQYSHKEIEKYEAVYGRNFVSPGGLQTAQEFCAMLDLQPRMRVLDVGCGIGGGAFYMAQQFGVQVDGLDLSTNMLAIASERTVELGLSASVKLIHADILEFQPSARSDSRSDSQYDRLYSRDVFLHIHDKSRLIAKLRESLRPGGKLLFTDYCCGEGSKSAEFERYIAQRHYALCTVAEYARLLEEAGFVSLIAEDRTMHFIEILEREAEKLLASSLDKATKRELYQSWQSKIKRAQEGEQRWGLFLAQVED